MLIRKNKTLYSFFFGFVVLLLICFYGLSLTMQKNTASASMSSENLTMYSGLSLNPEDSLGRLSVSVTAEQYAKLNEPPTEQTFLWFTESIPNPYFLILYRVKTIDKYNQIQNGDSLFNLDHSVSEISLDEGERVDTFQVNSEKLKQTSIDGEFYYTFIFQLPIDYETEYFYFVVFSELVLENALKPTASQMYKAIEKSSNYVCRSVKTVAENVLANVEYDEFDDNQIAILQRMACLTVPDSSFTVNLKYKQLIDYGNIQTVTEPYQVDNLYMLNKEMVASSVFTLAGRTNLFGFNCVYFDGYCLDNVDTVTSAKVVLAVDDYSYSYDNSTQTGTLEIIYKPFHYNDFAVRINDNNTADDNNFTAYVYFTDVSYSSETGIVTMSLPFSGDSADHTKIGIENLLFNSFGWLCDINYNSFNVGPVPDGVNVTVNDTHLLISFNKDDDYKLVDLSISATAEIIEDYNCSVDVKYVELSYSDENIVSTVKTKTDNVLYSVYVNNYTNSSAFYSLYGELIDSAVTLKVLDGEDFYVYDGVSCSKDGDTNFSVTVVYSYNTLLKCITDSTHHIKFYALTKNSLTYYLNEFDFGVPSGYQIFKLSTPDTSDLSINFNASSPNESSVTVISSPNQAKVLTLSASIEKITEPDSDTDTTPLPDDELNETLDDKDSDKDEESSTSGLLEKLIPVLSIMLLLAFVGSVSDAFTKRK